MNNYPTLREISWKVDEPTYREDTALSYSTLARFEREGFNKLNSLFAKVDTPSLTFGSAVDALITGGQEEFDKNFVVADFPHVSDTVAKIVETIFAKYGEQYQRLGEINYCDIIAVADEFKYQPNWKPETRAKVINEQGEKYYFILKFSQGRKVINTEIKAQIDNTVNALRYSSATSYFFAPNSSFTPEIYREYQLKFKSTLNGINYRCMPDLIITDHRNKKVYPFDLKKESQGGKSDDRTPE